MYKFLLLLLSLGLSLELLSQSADSLQKIKIDSLAGVTVQAKMPVVEYRSDKTILNVSADIASVGGHALDALRRAPGVSVLNEETITMAGKSGVNVLVDGRPLRLEGKDLANYLLTIPASAIARIELMTNPSSKYDAQGNAGVINIRLNKPVMRGVNADLNSAYTLSKHYRANLAGTINLREGRWNVYLKGAGGLTQQHTKGSILRRVGLNGQVKSFRNATTDIDKSENSSLEAGLDFFLSRRSTFGFIAKSSRYLSPMLTPGITTIANGTDIDSSLRTLVTNNTANQRRNYNLNYRFEDSTGRMLNIDFDHTGFSNNTGAAVNTAFVDRSGTEVGLNFRDQQLNTQILINSLRLDYNDNLGKKIKLEAGMKANTVTADNDLNAFLSQNQGMVADTGRSNQFNYLEKVYASYASLSMSSGKWQFQTGVRAEYTQVRGLSTDLLKNRQNYPDSSYLNVFPSAFIRYALNKSNSLGLSYSRRINRPTYQDLNPFQYVYDNYTTETGNPYLTPELSQSIEASWILNNQLNITAGYSQTTNSMQTISRQKGDVTDATRINLGFDRRMFVNIGYYSQLTSWWNISANLSPFLRQYRGVLPEGKLDINTSGMNWYVNNDFQLPKSWKAQISSWGNAGTSDGMFKIAWLGSLDAGVSRPLFNKRCMLRLGMLDIFNTQRWLQRVRFANVHFDYRRKWESRGLRLQFSWKIGSKNYASRSRKTGAEEENSRIK
jgi:iron complex outermembrane receptor protein